MKRLFFFLFSFLFACHKPPPVDVDASPPAVAVASSPVAVEASTPAPRKLPSEREVVEAWNAAHTKHDLDALKSLYARNVDFYGQKLTNDQCVARKKAAFDKSPDYVQSIHDVAVGTDGVVTFTKTSTSRGKSTDYPAVLVVGGGLVTAETDKVTEANLAAKAARDSTWCLAALWVPNDKVMPPYRISAAHAYEKARLTKYFKDMEASRAPDFIDFGQISCPTSCDRTAPRKCGYDLRLENHSERVSSDPEPHSNLIDWVHVDAVDGTLWYEADGWQSEPLPP